MNFKNCEVVIEQRNEQGVQPAILIKTEDGKVSMILITNGFDFNIHDVTGVWDIIDGKIQYVGDK